MLASDWLAEPIRQSGLVGYRAPFGGLRPHRTAFQTFSWTRKKTKPLAEALTARDSDAIREPVWG